MMIKVISGGQTGADQGGLRAARAIGIETGGFAPKGWLTETGPAPWLADFGLVECALPGYPARTEANVFASDAVVWFGDPDSRGGTLTYRLVEKHGKGWLYGLPGGTLRPSNLAYLLTHGWADIGTLMIAGNRESKAPGIGGRVERFLTRAFRLAGYAND